MEIESDFCLFLHSSERRLDFSGHFINIIEDAVSFCVQSLTSGLVHLIYLMKTMGALSLALTGAQADTVNELRF